jgi:hypothetical protein
MSTPKFKVGDKVLLTAFGEVGIVLSIWRDSKNQDRIWYDADTGEGTTRYGYEKYMEKVNE